MKIEVVSSSNYSEVVRLQKYFEMLLDDHINWLKF